VRLYLSLKGGLDKEQAIIWRNSSTGAAYRHFCLGKPRQMAFLIILDVPNGEVFHSGKMSRGPMALP